MRITTLRRRQALRLVLALASATAPATTHATVQVTADVSVHDLYRGEKAVLTVFRLRNMSTAGETIGSVMVIPPAPVWSIKGCPSAPAGWSRTLVAGSCVYRSAPGTQDDIRAA